MIWVMFDSMLILFHSYIIISFYYKHLERRLSKTATVLLSALFISAHYLLEIMENLRGFHIIYSLAIFLGATFIFKATFKQRLLPVNRYFFGARVADNNRAAVRNYVRHNHTRIYEAFPYFFPYLRGPYNKNNVFYLYPHPIPPARDERPHDAAPLLARYYDDARDERGNLRRARVRFHKLH